MEPPRCCIMLIITYFLPLKKKLVRKVGKKGHFPHIYGPYVVSKLLHHSTLSDTLNLKIVFFLIESHGFAQV